MREILLLMLVAQFNLALANVCNNYGFSFHAELFFHVYLINIEIIIKLIYYCYFLETFYALHGSYIIIFFFVNTYAQVYL